ncbi:DUF992 domain-containing protein [Aestuariivirga sp.]|uniref:DUF992 domain-containing protein n=1 Tax=Aestuariivirga sp. TaxID=2650926 RepID=UPI0025BFE25D|nr:DUF992 domain-containing protein [Aestuariivirga sp.]MCA3556208.1 DUF992 domain-containing protein [Aestuariivirga sp.]
MKKLAIAALVTLGLAASPAFARQQSGVKIGVLTCDVSASVGMIVASSRTLNCRFARSVGGTEYYTGTIERLGVDIGFTGQGVMSWVVFAPGQIARGALKGKYAGASAEASVAVGLGANVLVGGGNKSIALQPLSIQAQTGLNVAAGVAAMTLKPAKKG